MSSLNDTIQEMFDSLSVKGITIGKTPPDQYGNARENTCFIQITQVIHIGETDGGNMSNIVHQIEAPNYPDCFEQGKARCVKASRIRPLVAS